MFRKMLVTIFALIALGFVLGTNPLEASPGTLDHRGGHNCWNQCEKWGLYQGEYHIHEGSQQYHHEDG